MGFIILLSRRSILVLVLSISLFPKDYGYTIGQLILILDVRKGLRADMLFDLGQPFKPFEQLMGVLPSRSRKLLPEAYRVSVIPRTI
jgi:hypothetical protein